MIDPQAQPEEETEEEQEGLSFPDGGEDGAAAPDLDPDLLDQLWDGELSRAEADVMNVFRHL
jgi:hypothetical protein